MIKRPSFTIYNNQDSCLLKKPPFLANMIFFCCFLLLTMAKMNSLENFFWENDKIMYANYNHISQCIFVKNKNTALLVECVTHGSMGKSVNVPVWMILMSWKYVTVNKSVILHFSNKEEFNLVSFHNYPFMPSCEITKWGLLQLTYVIYSFGFPNLSNIYPLTNPFPVNLCQCAYLYSKKRMCYLCRCENPPFRVHTRKE